MEKYRISRWSLTMRSEKHLVTTINKIWREPSVLNRNGGFKLLSLKKYSDGCHYISYKIPKKHGGFRLISVPCKKLYYIQKCIAVLLNSIYRPNENTFGFIDGKSIVGNAQKHVGKDIVYNIDLKDFFNSITYDTIIEKLIRQPYYFSFSSAKLLTGLLTVDVCGEKVIPQGAPSSPILTNIIANHLDVRLSKFAEKHNLTYSRYADDITISFDKSVLRGWSGHGLYKGLRDIIFDIIRTEGFEINKHKTRISFINQRHEVTGLIVNKKVNVRRCYIKNIRTVLHNWEKDGYIIAGYIFFKHYEKSNPSKKRFVTIERVLDGQLSFIKMVKGEDDLTYKKLKERFDILCDRDFKFLDLNAQFWSNIKVFFSSLRNYESLGLLKEMRLFTEQEKTIVASSVIVPCDKGKTVRFAIVGGGQTFIPLSPNSPLGVGESVDFDKALLLMLKREDGSCVYRVEAW